VQAWSFEFIDREQHDAKESIAIVGGTTANGGNGVGVADVFEVGGAGAGGRDCEVVEAGFGGFCAGGRSRQAAGLGFGVGGAIGDLILLCGGLFHLFALALAFYDLFGGDVAGCGSAVLMVNGDGVAMFPERFGKLATFAVASKVILRWHIIVIKFGWGLIHVVHGVFVFCQSSIAAMTKLAAG
jgi:hypothetical protein